MTGKLEIVDGVLTSYSGNEETVVIPEGVVSIERPGFYVQDGNKHLKSVICPNSLKEIGSSTFSYCESLDEVVLPKGIERIRSLAFSNSGIRKINIPESCIVDEGAFHKCFNFANTESGLYVFKNRVINVCKNIPGNGTTVNIDEGVEEIDSDIYEYRDDIKTIDFPKSLKKIGYGAFRNSSVSTIRLLSFPEFGSQAFNRCADLSPKTFDRDTVLYYYFSAGKSIKSVGEVCEKIIDEDLIANMERTLVLLEECDSEKPFDKFSKYIISKSGFLSGEFYNRANLLFMKKGMKSASFQLVKNNLVSGSSQQEERLNVRLKAEQIKNETEELEKARLEATEKERLIKGKRPDEKEAEMIAAEYIKKNGLNQESITSLNIKVYYKDSKLEVKPEVLSVLLDAYVRQWRECFFRREISNGWKAKVSKEADLIYSYLDEKSVNAYLLRLVNTIENYQPYVLSLGRFATDETVQDLIAIINKRRPNKKMWDQNVEQALYLNDSIYAIQYFESKKCLDNYAKMRGTTAQQIRDTRMVPDLGFDEDGSRRFNNGDINITVKVLPDLSLELFDVNANKAIKSFPKNKADKKSFESLHEQYDEFKKQVEKYAKEMTENIKRLHVSQEAINKTIWEKVYINNPVTRVLSKGIIWVDGENSFIPSDNSVVDMYDREYEPKEFIRVANVISMDKNDVGKWQEYLIKNKIKQPFEQIWEPVMNVEKINIEERYKGMILSDKERRELKKVMKAKGIDVYSDKIDSIYDHRNQNYVFSEYNTMHFGDYIEVVYRIKTDKSIVFDELRENPEASKEAINTILFELEKAVIKQDIIQDRNEFLTEEKLNQFTLSQIISFIKFAAEHNSSNCSMIILDHKNRKYDYYDHFDELSLNL